MPESHETDDVIFLLSTDWFSSWVKSMELWQADISLLDEVKLVARRAVTEILHGEKDYYLVDLSPARKAESFSRFMVQAKSLLGARRVASLLRLIALVDGDVRLSRNEKWAIKLVLLRGVTQGFGEDARSALGDGVVSAITDTVERLGVVEIPFQPESRWDVDLDGKFGGLPGRLGDYADATFSPNVLLISLASATKRLGYDEIDIELLADWVAGAVRDFSMFVDARSLKLLIEEMATEA